MKHQLALICDETTILEQLIPLLEGRYRIDVLRSKDLYSYISTQKPDLFVLANRKPSINEDTLTSLRDYSAHSAIPVIAITDFPQEDSTEGNAHPEPVNLTSYPTAALDCAALLLGRFNPQDLILSNQLGSTANPKKLPYHLLFEHMLSGLTYCKMIFTDGKPTDFLYLDTNPTFEKMSGLHDVVGKHLTEVIPGVAQSDPQLLEIHGRVVTTGEPIRFENYVTSMQRWFSSAVYRPHEGHFVCIFDDITERKNSEQQLAFQATLLNNITDAIYFTDVNSRITYWSNAAIHTYGWSSEEAIGQIAPDLLNSEYFETTQEEILHLLDETGSATWHGTQVCKNGDRVFIEGTTIVIHDPNGNLSGYAAANKNISDQKKSQAQIEHLAYFDQLTGLPNRTLFSDRLNQSLAICQRTGHYGAIIFIDLDQFKKINDVFGHDFGDCLLKEAASRQVECLRRSDTVSRFGGDEFVVLLPELSTTPEASAALAMSIAEKIRSSLSSPYHIQGRHCSVSASMGITLFPSVSLTENDIIREADIAMYRAKNLGRNSLVFFEHHMQKAINERFSLEQELGKAIETNKLELYLQSQFNQSGEVVGAEALVRWNHPTRGFIPPDQFIPLAEDTGLINRLGEWVLEQTCQILKHIINLPVHFRLAVNVSPRQFYDSEFLESVTRIVLHADIDPSHLTLEVTENLFFERTMDVMSRMNALVELGIHFSIDDFGTGYSSIAYLKSLPLSELKIDKSFVQDIPQDLDDVALVETILSMAHHFSLRVVAEGVETQSQLDALLRFDCDYFQGYFFERPQPADAWLCKINALNC